jgi:hypothetical protein
MDRTLIIDYQIIKNGKKENTQKPIEHQIESQVKSTHNQ